jgi:hypothetical protein
MKKCFVVFILMLLAVRANAGFEKLEQGGRATALGGAFTGVASGAFTVFYNPAGLMPLVQREAVFFYSQPYGIPELSYASFAFVDPVTFKFGSFGVAATTYGFDLYRETTLSLAYASNFGDKFFYGVSTTYYNLSIAGYGSDASVGFNVGVLAVLSSTVRLGGYAMNLNRPTIGVSKEPLPQVLTLGVAYTPSKPLLISADVEQDVKFPLQVKIGVEYEAIKYLVLRGGFATPEPSRFSGGFGIRYAGVTLDYAVYSHTELGLTHQASVSIPFGKASTHTPLEAAVPEPIRKLAAGETLNLNTATFEALLRVPGLNDVLTDRIIRYRTERGGKFTSLQDLTDIKGIDDAKLEQLQKYLKLD